MRDEVRISSLDFIDLKAYEPAMRHLIDTYIRADDSEKLSVLNELTLIQLIVERGPDAVNALPERIKNSEEAVAETIENNVRKLIIKALIPPLLAHWQPLPGVAVSSWGIKKMKTKWGSCNVAARRIWLNLELAKKPESCLEYIVVHELVHFLERQHNARFTALMTQHLPDWQQRRALLKASVLGHETWAY